MSSFDEFEDNRWNLKILQRFRKNFHIIHSLTHITIEVQWYCLYMCYTAVVAYDCNWTAFDYPWSNMVHCIRPIVVRNYIRHNHHLSQNRTFNCCSNLLNTICYWMQKVLEVMDTLIETKLKFIECLFIHSVDQWIQGLLSDVPSTLQPLTPHHSICRLVNSWRSLCTPATWRVGLVFLG